MYHSMQDYAYVRFQSCSDNIIVSSNSTPARLNTRKQIKQSLVIVISVCLDTVFKTLKKCLCLYYFLKTRQTLSFWKLFVFLTKRQDMSDICCTVFVLCRPLLFHSRSYLCLCLLCKFECIFKAFVLCMRVLCLSSVQFLIVRYVLKVILSLLL